jgi:hypothetical protein
MSESQKVVSSWSTLVENFNTSALDFYNAVETNVLKRQAPDIKYTRKNLSESHIFSSCVFRSYPATHSGESGQPFRRNPATCSG